MAPAHPAAAWAARYPVQRELDGDFSLAEIVSAVGHPHRPAAAQPRPGLAEAAHRAQLWRLDRVGGAAARVLAAAARPAHPEDGHDHPSGDDLALLHAFEVSPLWRPPVAARLHELTPPLAQAWLALAGHWIGLSATTRDLRFFNAACKLLGAVWIRFHAAPDHHTPDHEGWTALAQPLAAVAHQANGATERLATDLRHRLVLPAPPTATAEPDDLLRPPAPAPSPTPSVVVLATAGSAGARRFLAAASPTLPIAAVCWYGPDRDGGVLDSSGYSTAWYPREHAGHVSAAGQPPPSQPHPVQIDTPAWDAVATALHHQRPDLVVLLGMPIVPAPILQKARLGVINAHNGALPHYRGMDAVGWALINNDPIVCSLHLARPAVDQGEVLATQPVPFEPAGTLRNRVKTAQLRLLLAATRFVATTGRLPSATPQRGGRQFYRLHPHLKRVLDAWTDHRADQFDPTGRG